MEQGLVKKDLLGFQWLRNIKSKVYPFWRLDTLFSNKRYMNIEIIKNGGWHFTSIKKPKEIFYKLSNFMHHLEFEESGLTLKDMENMVNQKKYYMIIQLLKKIKNIQAT